MHLKEELEREHERRTTEMREAARRLKDDCSHQVEMERFSFIYDCLLIIALRIAVQRIIDKRVTLDSRFRMRCGQAGVGWWWK